jgi:uncharacterized membrane protein YkgB
MATVIAQDATTSSWRRWFRRSNVYIAEYILMLILVASFIGVLVSLWFTFFGLMYGDTSVGVAVAATQIGSLLVVGPAAFWLYARVTGEEMMHPELQTRTSRTVFLTIWMVIAVLALVGMVATIVSSFVNAIFGLESNFGATLVTQVLPGLFSVATVVFGLCMVVKHTSRKFVMLAAMVLAVTAVVLLVANATMVLVRKDSVNATSSSPSVSPQVTPESDENCTITSYFDEECSYDDYLKDSRSRMDTRMDSRYYN